MTICDCFEAGYDAYKASISFCTLFSLNNLGFLQRRQAGKHARPVPTAQNGFSGEAKKARIVIFLAKLYIREKSYKFTLYIIYAHSHRS